jgi:hypothetical protein
MSSIVSAAVLSSCSIIPTAPMVGALPGPQKTYDEFRNDDFTCRGTAQAAVTPPAQDTTTAAPTTTAPTTTAPATAAGSTSAGTTAGGSAGGAAESPAANITTPYTAPTFFSGPTWYELQRWYDATYLQCMFARGHAVPAPFAYVAPGVRYGPPARDYGVPPDYVPRQPPPNAPAPTGPPPDYPAPPVRG